jgi:hypothetical protein
MRLVLCLLACIFCSALPATPQDHGPFHPARFEVYFSPNGGETEACVAAIAAAKTTINVQA